MSTKLLSQIKEVHKRKPNAVYLRVKKRLTYLLSNMKMRTTKAEGVFDVTKEELSDLVTTFYGKGCKYCDTQLTYKNYVCDHILPLSRGGQSTRENLQMICKRCNTQKGPLLEEEYIQLLAVIHTFSEESQRYAKSKLSKAGF